MALTLRADVRPFIPSESKNWNHADLVPALQQSVRYQNLDIRIFYLRLCYKREYNIGMNYEN